MRKARFNTSFFMEHPHHTARYFGGGPSIIMGGSTDAELQARLNEAAMENDRMLARAADEQLRLQKELDQRDAEMKLSMEQAAAKTEADMARAQKALDVELKSLSDSESEDALKAEFDALEAALAAGLGKTDTGDGMRPV
jgi:uncharacterized protein (DUF3084 family)